MSWEWVGGGRGLLGTDSREEGSSDDRQLIHRSWLPQPVPERWKPDGMEGRAKQWVGTKLDGMGHRKSPGEQNPSIVN